MKYLENKLTHCVFILMAIINISLGNYFILVNIPICIGLIYYNYKRNVASNAKFQQLFVENSEQKLQLLKSDAELSTFFKITPNILAIASMGQYKRLSDNFIDTLGYDKEEIINHSFFDFIHPDDIQKTLDIVERAKGQDNVLIDFVNRLRKKDGHYITVKWQAVLVDDTFYASANNITNEIKFNVLFEKINTPLCIFDKEMFLFSSVNKAFASSLGYSVEEMVDKHLSEFIHKEDFKASFDVVQTGEEVTAYKNRYVCKNGDIKTLVWSTLGDDDRFVYCTAKFLN